MAGSTTAALVWFLASLLLFSSTAAAQETPGKWQRGRATFYVSRKAVQLGLPRNSHHPLLLTQLDSCRCRGRTHGPSTKAVAAMAGWTEPSRQVCRRRTSVSVTRSATAVQAAGRRAAALPARIAAASTQRLAGLAGSSRDCACHLPGVAAGRHLSTLPCRCLRLLCV